MRKLVLSLSLLLPLSAVLTACASGEQAKLASAATTPLNDLNLVSAPIPEVLLQAEKGPYKVVDGASCADLAAAVRALDEVLGPDLDAPASEANPSLIERGSNAAVGAAQRAAEGIVPYRGWIRKLSGAERYAKQVAVAIAAGAARRAFLKGFSRAKGC